MIDEMKRSGNEALFINDFNDEEREERRDDH